MANIIDYMQVHPEEWWVGSQELTVKFPFPDQLQTLKREGLDPNSLKRAALVKLVAWFSSAASALVHPAKEEAKVSTVDVARYLRMAVLMGQNFNASLQRFIYNGKDFTFNPNPDLSEQDSLDISRSLLQSDLDLQVGER